MSQHHAIPETSLLLSRRKALGLLGAFGAAGLAGCAAGEGGDVVQAATGTTSNGTTTTCILTPALTEGPYFVDEKLNRSDITDGQSGVPLTLNMNVYNANNASCAVLPNVQIDIWHCNAQGLYSDINVQGNAGQSGLKYLRGYQVSDASGNLTFKTIYPGWYNGRTVHIHLKARIFDAANNVTKEFNTQIFFDDSLSDSVFTQTPYNSRGTRNTRNSNDGIYNSTGSNSSAVLIALSGSNSSGYSGSFGVGLSL